ncbi:MAG TPA: PepSY domain-containing protein [Patescibacteria group bacterium]|nr:PepSY domain-containing protein [Patescibacteria group bacterium]
MIRLLYKVHRWAGVALALFMTIWILSGLVIVYASGTLPSRAQKLVHAETLSPQAGWLSLGEAWQRSGGQATIVDARLLRIAGEPHWLVEDDRGHRVAVSAIDGHVQTFSGEQAQRIAQQWLSAESAASLPAVTYLDTIDATSSLRNYTDLKPFLRVAVDDGAGTELLISATSGEVLQAVSRVDRGLYLVGNWIHFFRPLDAIGAGDYRRDVLIWAVAIAAITSVTGMVIGWLRWKPGYFAKPTYPQGRTQPYRTFWLRWHFWTGLIGGSLAVLWTVSGYMVNNPWQWFSAATATRQELVRYQGADLPDVVKSWQPAALASATDAVELGWRRLGDKAVLLAYTRDGGRMPQAVDGAVTTFDEATLLAAAQRLGGKATISLLTLQRDYDNYYYPTHRQDSVDKPLPVLRVELSDAGHTHLYLDPQDGRLLLKQDASRRAYRWLFSALHNWDIGWLYTRPLWDAWMVTWIGFSLVLSVSSVVLGWRRLRRTFALRKAEEEAKPVTA